MRRNSFTGLKTLSLSLSPCLFLAFLFLHLVMQVNAPFFVYMFFFQWCFKLRPNLLSLRTLKLSFMWRLSVCTMCHPVHIPLRSTEPYVVPFTYSLISCPHIQYRELFALGQSDQGVNLAAHLCLQPRKSMSEAYAPAPTTCLYGIHRDNVTKPNYVIFPLCN